MISAADKREREDVVADVIGTHRAEGISFPPELLAFMNQYAEGDLSLEQLTAAMREYGAKLSSKGEALVDAA